METNKNPFHFKKSIFILSNRNPKMLPRQAKKCLENILYEISNKDLHNIAAMLAQEQSVQVQTFGNSQGNWTWPVVHRFLHERGHKCTQASKGKEWLLNSPSFLVKPGSGFVGFVDSSTLESYSYKESQWITTKGPLSREEINTALQKGQTFAVHQMWAPLESFYAQNNTFHITTDNSQWTRYECHPEACWRLSPVSYAQRETAVKKFMRAHKKTPILMSNSQEMVICAPHKSGWKSSPLLNYEPLDIQETSQRAAETLTDCLVQHITDHNHGWGVMAHALFTALYQIGGKVPKEKFSRFTDEELEILEKYNNGMYKMGCIKGNTTH
jgi:hypothetical protein